MSAHVGRWFAGKPQSQYFGFRSGKQINKKRPGTSSIGLRFTIPLTGYHVRLVATQANDP